jgi:predicted TPR repeat methyltransferase
MARAQSPIKVHEATKEKVRAAALATGVNQAEVVEKAVDEYVERHRDEFAARLEHARVALLGGEASALAYASGVTEEDVARLGGVKSDH